MKKWEAQLKQNEKEIAEDYKTWTPEEKRHYEEVCVPFFAECVAEINRIHGIK